MLCRDSYEAVRHVAYARRHMLQRMRPSPVREPIQSAVVPSPSSKHEPLSLYAEYDGASRVSALYDGDYGITKFARDGMGRAIKRWL